MKNSNQKILEIKECARCGKIHKNLSFKKFIRPLQNCPLYNYWSICPITNEPIIMMVMTNK